MKCLMLVSSSPPANKDQLKQAQLSVLNQNQSAEVPICKADVKGRLRPHGRLGQSEQSRLTSAKNVIRNR